MNYTTLNELVKETVEKIPNVNTYTEGDITENWHRETKYSAVNMALESAQRTSNTMVYNVVLYYADRPTKDKSNRRQIYDDGVNILQSLLNGLPDSISYTSPIIYTMFEDLFEDVLIGCYARVNLEVEFDLGKCSIN